MPCIFHSGEPSIPYSIHLSSLDTSPRPISRTGFVPKKQTETNKSESDSIETHLFVNFRKAEAQVLGQVAGFGPTQHVVGAEQARQPEHRFADHRQMLSGFIE